MAIQLPDFSSLAPVNPQPESGDHPFSLPRYEEQSPEAQGEAVLGQGLEHVGQEAGQAGDTITAYQKIAQVRAERGVADADLVRRLVPLDAALKTETDPQKVAGLGQQYQDAIAISANAIGDPGARQLWMADHAHVVAGGQAGALVRVDQIRRGAALRQSDDITADLVRQVPQVAATDPRALPDTLERLKGLYTPDASLRLGLTPDEGFRRLQAAQRDLIHGAVVTQMAHGDIAGARTTLDTYRGSLGAAYASDLDQRLTHADDKAGNLAYGRSVWGGGDKGYAGNLGPAGPAPAPPDEYRPIIDQAASSAGVPAELLTRLLGAESGFNATARGPANRSGEIARGVAQFLPSTARTRGLANPDDPAQAIPAAASYLADLHEQTGSWLSALHGYLGGDPTQDASYLKNGVPQLAIALDRGGSVGGADQGAPTEAPGGLAPLPDLDAKLGRIESDLAAGRITPERARAGEAFVRSQFNEMHASQASDRAALTRRLSDGIAMLADGRDPGYDPAPLVRHFFPPPQADDFLQKWQDAKDGGQLIAGMRLAGPDQIGQQRAQLAARLDQPGAPDYARNRRLLTMFDEGLRQRAAALAKDPVSYLAQYDPQVQRLRAAIDPKNPQSTLDYATTALVEQTRLGVPAAAQHIMTAPAAQRIVQGITGDPEHAPAALEAMAAQYGRTWPHAWTDLVTLGKLPAGWQLVGQLADYDKENAGLLARQLAQQAKSERGSALAERPGQGTQSIAQQLAQAVDADRRVQQFDRSMANGFVSEAGRNDVIGAIHALARARYLFAADDPETAAAKAVNAAIGHYEFAGVARAPADVFDRVVQGTRQRLAGLSAANVAVPPGFGGGKEPTPDEYVAALKAAGTWINSPRNDAWWLIDQAARFALDRAGNHIAVPFANAAAPAAATSLSPEPPMVGVP